MSDNYIVINRKRTELTDEQLKALGIEARKNPFERTNRLCGEYFYTDAFCVGVGSEEYSDVWKELWDVANYFNDKRFANQVALHQLLYRKLLKFAYDNECEDDQRWDCENRHWCIRYDHCDKVFCVTWYDTFHYSGVYFPTRESAECAIEEVVKPFMNEHPDFVW